MLQQYRRRNVCVHSDVNVSYVCYIACAMNLQSSIGTMYASVIFLHTLRPYDVISGLVMSLPVWWRHIHDKLTLLKLMLDYEQCGACSRSPKYYQQLGICISIHTSIRFSTWLQASNHIPLLPLLPTWAESPCHQSVAVSFSQASFKVVHYVPLAHAHSSNTSLSWVSLLLQLRHVVGWNGFAIWWTIPWLKCSQHLLKTRIGDCI